MHNDSEEFLRSMSAAYGGTLNTILSSLYNNLSAIDSQSDSAERQTDAAQGSYAQMLIVLQAMLMLWQSVCRDVSSLRRDACRWLAERMLEWAIAQLDDGYSCSTHRKGKAGLLIESFSDCF